MKSLVLLTLILSLSYSASAQELKKKFFGSYEGIIPAYKLDLGTDVVDVESTTIKIVLNADGTVSQTIGNTVQNGTWSFFIAGEKYYILEARLEGQLIAERIIVYKKGKAIGREGIFPQPTANLKKVKS